jgi:sulfatase maturation enzyme AslB (radical SAM superfamily)
MTIGLDFYVGNQTDKPTHKDSAVNVIYFTNKCNLACTYCYEDLANRPSQILGKKDIRSHVDAIIEREHPDNQTLIVLFGGEPTLEWDNLIYLMDYAYAKKKNIHFNLETNGIKFLSDKFLETFKSNYYYKRGLLSIDISFDGVGNGERIFHNGSKSTPAMLKIFKRLAIHGIRYRMRYTIQKSNVRMCYEDITKLINSFKPDRLITSVAWDSLSEDDIKHLIGTKEKFRADWRQGKVPVPICELFCDMCSGCGERKELKTYFTDEGNVTTYGNYENSPKFHDFKDKVTIHE